MDRNREKNLINIYNDYMKENCFFKDKLLIVPQTPKSFTDFPTIVLKETSNTDYNAAKTLDRIETMENCNYTVEFYTKDIIYNNSKYHSLDVINELKYWTFKFFNDIGFNRITANKGEYIDITIDRYISVFQGKFNNWNGQLI